jgi:hypothetical protein
LPPEIIRLIEALAEDDALRDHKRAIAEREK